MRNLMIETFILCLGFLGTILVFVAGDRKGGLHWYPEHVKKAALERSVITEREMQIRSRQVKILGSVVCAGIILFSVFFINQVQDFTTACKQIAFMVLTLNWMDAIFVDYFWVRKTSYWVIPELADIRELGKPIRQIIIQRVTASMILVVLSAGLACIVFLL